MLGGVLIWSVNYMIVALSLLTNTDLCEELKQRKGTFDLVYTIIF